MTDQQKHRLEEDLEVDFSFGLQGVSGSAPTCTTSAAPPPAPSAAFPR